MTGRLYFRMKSWKLLILATAAILFSTAAYAQMPEISPVSLGIGNRQAVWIVMQTHLLFAAFILGAPIFVVICEYIGMRSKDERYDRLAKEVTKVTTICYSLTALFGGFAIMVLLGLYPGVNTHLIKRFFT